MYQSMVEGRYVPWSLLVKDMPKSRHQDLDFIVDQLDWGKNVDPKFKDNHYLEPVPVADTRSEGFVDRWIVYGKVDGEQLFTAKELTVEPKRTVTIRDPEAYGVILTQGYGAVNQVRVSTPSMIRFGEMTEDEIFVTAATARDGVRIENHSATDPLVLLKHFGPGNPDNEPLKATRRKT